MKILYVGTYVDSYNLKKLRFHSIAANNYQTSFLSSLTEVQNTIYGISVRSTKFFSDKFFFNASKIKFRNNSTFHLLPVINLPLIKQFIFFILIFSHSIFWSFRYKNEKKVIILFNTFSYMFIPLKLISFIFKIRFIGLILDVPSKKISILKRIVLYIEHKLQTLFINLFNRIIVITKNIAIDFAPNKPYIVIEGFIHKIPAPILFKPTNPKEFNVTYTGLLDENSGILRIIQLFLNKKYINIYLNIYGYGIYSEMIKTKIKDSDRITYHGYVSHEESLLAQKKADILVIPRLPDSFLTKYTFPSKIIEYTNSVKPIILNKLQGVDFIKYNYLNLVEDPTFENWNHTLLKITGNYSYYSKIALNGYELLSSQNSIKTQASLINKFIAY